MRAQDSDVGWFKTFAILCVILGQAGIVVAVPASAFLLLLAASIAGVTGSVLGFQVARARRSRPLWLGVGISIGLAAASVHSLVELLKAQT